MAEKKKQTRLIAILIGFCLFSISVAGFDWLASQSGQQWLQQIMTPFASHNQPVVINNATVSRTDGQSDSQAVSQTASPVPGSATGPDASGTNNGNTLDPTTLAAGAVRKIPIYLVGAVVRPGIYEVAMGSYLYQLVDQAGGLTEDAAAEHINLALQLNTNQLIHIPTQKEWAAAPTPLANEASGPSGTPALVHINQADAAALDTLPGIGPATARTIVDYRTKNGPFRTLEDLMKIPGIKQSRFDAIRDLITLG